MKIKPIKVSFLNQYIKTYLKNNSYFTNMYVEGEVSNVRPSRTGYVYFTLSEGEATIKCVCFYDESSIKNGDKVVVNGSLSVYEARGEYQIIVKQVEKTGIGEILKQLELLKERIKAQGLLANKKEVCLFPTKIGIVTAKSSAALQDMLKTFRSVRTPFEVVIFDSLVQGESAKGTLIEGIKYFNNIEAVDVIIVARGGGSFEDLNIFNDLDIAEQLLKSTIPVVTGIGHEIDETLCDYAADIYCHTPTAAAEYVVRGYKNVDSQLSILYTALNNRVLNQIRLTENAIKSYRFKLMQYSPAEYLKRMVLQCDGLKERLKYNVTKAINENANQLKVLNERLQGNDYKKKLKGGYSLVLNDQNQLITDKSNISQNGAIKIMFDKFVIKAHIDSVEEIE